jgi:hypothetical protein
MSSETTLNGTAIEYRKSLLATLYERICHPRNRAFYTKIDQDVLLIGEKPTYLFQDIFRYKATIARTNQDITTRLENPVRERIEILPKEFDGKIVIERDKKKGTIIVRTTTRDRSYHSRKTFSFDDLENLEKYVRGLY